MQECLSTVKKIVPLQTFIQKHTHRGNTPLIRENLTTVKYSGHKSTITK